MGRVVLQDPYRGAKLWHRFSPALRRLFRGRIFAAIERGDDAKALHFATPSVLLKSGGVFGQSPLVAAISENRTNLALEFISRGGSYAGDGTLAHAAMRGNLEVVEALLKAGNNPDEPLRERDFNTGYTPLMWAVNRRHLPIVRRLLMAGANVDAVAEDGSTPVMMTANASPESWEALEMLCAYGSDIHKKDRRGRSVVREARDRAKNSGKPQMSEIIERHFPGPDFEAA